ncbi:MAG: S41 family peptidase [Alphaproteobacteria bacterium]|nr:S41 family peptidase [Alphaproteobacteria bacterium]MBQ3116723.1 S41 family peptidase [Alphaproteobacteria bacterium]MBQ6854293.1 S41 family peptidase [Alphaproteobacteria bacterium]MBQ8558248.1 S41 family peptidase [Alphaproteobacteria bacterium]
MKFLAVLVSSAVLLSAGCAIATQPSVSDSDMPDDPYALMELFGTAYQVIKREYVEETTDRKLVENAIDGMLSSLDPHSSFMNQSDFADLEEQTRGEFGGLGMEVSADNGMVRVTTPIDDTPAFKAGIQPGDYITHIDGESVIGQTLSESVKKLRGKPGTKVTITISRKDKEPFDVKMTRDIIHVKPVKYSAKEDIGYIRIITFSDDTTDMLHEAIQKLNKEIGEDRLIGYIIDVRNNPGGLLNEAVGVVDTFLNAGEIVSTRSRKPEEAMRFSAQEGDLTNGKPLVVMINEGSASASEIVAGALQDHHRALVVGLKSFGKGSVQTIKEIPGFGGIKMTTARYYTPTGRSIQATGIEPDVVIPRAKLEELPVLKGFGEGDLPGAIAAEEGKKAKDVKKQKTSKKENKKEKESSDSADSEKEKQDYQLDRAIDILRGIAIYHHRKEVK